MNKPTPCAEHRRRRQAGCPECRRYAREAYHYRKRPTAADNAIYDIAPVRDHIRTLLAAGMRLADIAEDAGLRTTGHLNRIMYGPDRKGCRTGLARRILAVRARPVETWLMDGAGVRRRVQALACDGWEQRALTERAGYHYSVGSDWANAVRVHRSTFDTVAALYRDLVGSDGGSLRARRWAERRGWHPPEAWSDATIDDPQAQPYDWCRDDVDEVAVAQVEEGRRRWADLNEAEQRELVRRNIGQFRPATLASRWKTTRGRVERLAAEVAMEAGEVAA